MLLKSHDLNKSDIISQNSIYYDENKQYFNTSIKKKIKIKNSNIKDTNILINALKDFSVKYELNYRKIMKVQKFVISFDELISLIRFTLESQRQLNNCIKNDLHNSKNLSQEFINELIYYFFTYEKVEKISPDNKIHKQNKSLSEKENININSINGGDKNIISIINKSPSYWLAEKEPCYNEKKKKEKYKDEKNEANNMKNNNSNNSMHASKSYYRRNKGPKLFSPEHNKIKEKYKKTEKKQKKSLNKSVEKRNNTIDSNFLSNNNNNYESTTKNRLSNNNEKRKSAKLVKTQKEYKNLSIYTACESLKSSSYIFKNKKKQFSCTQQYQKGEIKKKNNNYDSHNNINCEKKKENKKIIYYNQNMILGIKKHIITNNVPKPSNLANKLLQNGRKFITEFNGIKEEERKKQYYS